MQQLMHAMQPLLRDQSINLTISRDTRIITTCGSGVTAAILSAAFLSAGFRDVRLYDGSTLISTSYPSLASPFFDFSGISYTLPSGSTKTLLVKADVAKSTFPLLAVDA